MTFLLLRIETINKTAKVAQDAVLSEEDQDNQDAEE